MLDTSQSWYQAITADARRILISAIISIIDPDMEYGAVTSQSAAPYSQPEQIHDKEFTLTPYATLEDNRWVLDGTFSLVPDNNQPTGQVAYVSGDLCGADGTFATAQYVEMGFSNVSILQACTIFFPDSDYDGVADSFTVEVKQGGTAYYTKTFTGNTESEIPLDGFTVNDPDAIRVTVTKWSIPYRRMRVPEIVPGIYESWDGSMLAEFNVTQQANFSCLALPYGTCTLRMDNIDRRFEPRNKNGIFRSLEERQGIQVSIGVETESGPVMQPVGTFYQFSGGWRTSDNGITMQWELVDIIGLLADRQYLPPTTLPTTLDGWVASIVGQLGVNFASRYVVDPDYASLPLTANAADVSGKSCGEILRMACMATGTFPRADASTGYLAVEPYWSQGSKVTLDNLNAYPTLQANDDLAAIIFTINGEEYVVSGTSTASSNTVQVQNPFITTQAQALQAARMILATYGGNQISTTGRGNPASEIGDVDTVWLDESGAVAGRRMMQTFAFSDGVLQGCQSTLLQPDGALQFEGYALITESGTWTAPEGATSIRAVLVGGGYSGTAGTAGSWTSTGQDGEDGAGGYVLAFTQDINPGQSFAVTIGGAGEPTTMGNYSSANGAQYPTGYTDIVTGYSFARSGVPSPNPNTGDGGIGGKGGAQGNRHEETINTAIGGGIGGGDPAVGDTETVTVIDNYPGSGTQGTSGASGCVVVYWDKET